MSTAGKPLARKYSYDATKTLQRVWAFTGFECGKYLAAVMPSMLDALERHGELTVGKAHYSPEVRAELEAMSPATIDRYLAPARAKDPLRGISTTRPSPLLRSSITIRKTGDEVEDAPGFFEGDTVAHCGPTLRGEFCRVIRSAATKRTRSGSVQHGLYPGQDGVSARWLEGQEQHASVKNRQGAVGTNVSNKMKKTVVVALLSVILCAVPALAYGAQLTRNPRVQMRRQPRRVA